ncbi:universal stress protein [Mucilaginibacter ximonensis]|uniref:Universal stress protein n=1 Tax=Mucilaginibacter ximonensis TaxID=538021 RepID=A0ABW5YCB3_9SPHI
MKKLLVLTDFSANAAHAEAAALQLSAKLNADITLYHILPYIPMILSNSAGPLMTESTDILFEDSIEHLNKEANELRQLCDKITGCHTRIDCLSGDGSLADNVREMSGAIDMVIMGGRSGSAISHLLAGSETSAVISKARKPVFVIPAGANWDIPKKVVFATNFQAADLAAMDFLLSLAEALNFQLDIIHISRPDEVITEIGPEIAFRKYLAHRGLSCVRIFSEDMQPALQQYCQEHDVELLAMTHQHHSFISKLFGHSESKAVIAHQQVAALIFPPDFNQSL